ncbi:hypothetical protein [Actinacidiphila sp. bgisy167]|uniref:hypothetical protein n=1 Tax=Actinacidiphila sp. bgisy167 TaxID=3413797 RepID=UPI003D732AC0
MTRPTAAHSTLHVSAGVLLLSALLALSGCRQGSDDGTDGVDDRPSAAAFDVAEALSHADPAPYSAAVTMTTTVAGSPTVSQGRLNLNGPVTGRLTVRDPRNGVSDMRYTGERAYVRFRQDDGLPGRWNALPVPAGGRVHLGNLTGYAALLAGRPGADKGPERTAGLAVRRLSGTVTTGELAKLDPDVYGDMTADHIRSFDCEIWVTAQGRVVRFERSLVSGDRGPIRTVVTLSRFGAPEETTAPVNP